MINLRVFCTQVGMFLVLYVFCLGLGGCSSMQIEPPQNRKVINCADWTDWNKVATDTIHHGKYIPSRYNHIGIERDGRCLDNMGEFNCDDARYISKITFSGDNDVYMNKILDLRPAR